MTVEIIRDVVAAKDNETLRNNFISVNNNFILGTACKAAGHFVTESDDEYSVALIAFNEAIDSYDEEKGNFHSFAALVIRRRIYDYIRSADRFSGEILVEPSVMGGEIEEDSPNLSLQVEIRRREADLAEQNRC